MIRPKTKILVDGGDPQETRQVKAKILEQWASKNFSTPQNQFQYKAPGEPIPYENLDLEQGWETFELTRKRIEKFAADYRATLSRPA